VFLGPFFTPTSGVIDLFHGGDKPLSIASFSALAGRCDVGLFFIRCPDGFHLRPDYYEGFQMTMRQRRVAAFENAGGSLEPTWPHAGIPMVHTSSAPSKRQRS